jgi:hypothetical protein
MRVCGATKFLNVCKGFLSAIEFHLKRVYGHYCALSAHKKYAMWLDSKSKFYDGWLV